MGRFKQYFEELMVNTSKQISYEIRNGGIVKPKLSEEISVSIVEMEPAISRTKMRMEAGHHKIIQKMHTYMGKKGRELLFKSSKHSGKQLKYPKVLIFKK